MTKPSSSISSNSHKKAVLLALSVAPPVASGKRPGLLEIDLWRRNKLSKKRHLEVKSYIARDSECFQLWLDLLDAERQLKLEKQASHITLWQKIVTAWKNEKKLWMGGGLVAATTAVFVAVFGLKVFLAPDILYGINQNYQQFDSHPFAAQWHYQDYDKGLSFSIPTPYDIAKKAVLVGVREGLTELHQSAKLSHEWQAIINQYPNTLPRCEATLSTEQCQQQNVLLTDFGRWLALVQLQCSQPALIDTAEYFTLQQQRKDYFEQQLSTMPLLQPLKQQAQSWDTTPDMQILCNNIKNLLNHIDN